MHVVTLEIARAGQPVPPRPRRPSGPGRRPAPRPGARSSAAAEEAGVDIAAVADTHVHNDYVSGALGLARRHGADYLLVRRRAGRVRAGRRPRRRRGPASAGSTSGDRHPRPHPPPPVLPGPPPRPTRAARRRCSAAAACCTARSAAPTCVDEPAAPATWPAPSGPAPARSAPCDPDDPAAPHPRLRQLLRRAPPAASPTDGPATIGDQRARNPALTARPGPVRRRAGRRLRPDPLLLRAHGPAQPGRRRPAPARCRPGRSPPTR